MKVWRHSEEWDKGREGFWMRRGNYSRVWTVAGYEEDGGSQQGSLNSQGKMVVLQGN